MKYRLFTWLVVCAASLFTVAPRLYQAGAVCQVSLHYFWNAQTAHSGSSHDFIVPVWHPRAQFWNALAALQFGDAQAAITILKPLVSDGNSFALQITAKAYQEMGNYPAAIQAWKQAGNITALLQAAKDAEQAKDFDTALEAYYAVWQADPLQGTDSLAGFLRGVKKDPVAAEAVLRRSLQISPHSRSSPYWLFWLASVLEGQSRWAEAAQSYEQGIALVDLMYPGEKHLPLRYAKLAWAYQMSGQPDKSLVAMANALEQVATDPPCELDVWLLAGQLYETASLPEKALAAYQQALALQPDNKTAQHAVQQLSGIP